MRDSVSTTEDNAAHEISEASIRTQIVYEWIQLQPSQLAITLIVCFIEPLEGPVVIMRTRIHFRYQSGSPVSQLGESLRRMAKSLINGRVDAVVELDDRVVWLEPLINPPPA